MRLRIFFLLLATVYKSWAQCPTSVIGTQETGKLAIRVDNPNGAVLSANGTNRNPIKICKGQTLYVEDVTGGGNTGFWFEYQQPTIDFSTTLTPESTNKSKRYDKPGLYGLIMVGSVSTGYYACQTIQVLDKPEPVFEAVVCKPGEVTVVIPKDSARNPYEEFSIEWGDGTTEKLTQNTLPANRTHTYTNTTSGKTLTVTGSYAGSGCQMSVSNYVDLMHIDQPFKPTITEVGLANHKTSAIIQFVGHTTLTQEVFQKEVNGSYAATGIRTAGGVSTLTVPNLNSEKQYCFQIHTTGVCASGIASDEICTLPINVTATGTQLNVNWPQYPGDRFTSYTVSNQTTSFTPITTVSTTRFTDTDGTCGISYCYQVTVKVGSANSVSNQACQTVNVLTSPPAISDISTSVEANKAVLQWNAPVRAVSYTLYRAENGGNFSELVPELLPKTYTDTSANPSLRSYCYQVSYLDLCQNVAKNSPSVCTIYLQQKGKELQWTAASPFVDASARYMVEVMNSQGTVIHTASAGSKTSMDLSELGIEIEPGYTYQVHAVSANSKSSRSNRIEVRKPMLVYVQDAFTPNGDASNDVFRPTILNVESARLTIFDRWGNSIFTTTSEQPEWDGFINGKPAPQGNYSYRLDIRNATGDTFTKRGVFRLML